MKVMEIDREVVDAITQEEERQKVKLELIASENYVSQEVLNAVGSVLTNKYAEGYPGKRYYGGCEYVDVVENLARERAQKLFHCDHANVQPHSGSNANLAVYFTLLKPGDTILGLDLAHGGHLTHGSPVNVSGQLYNIVFYGVNRDTEKIDYDEVERLAQEKKPRLIIAGASAYPRSIDFEKFRRIADEVGAFLLADIAHIAGLVAVGLHPDSIPFAHFTTTTTHKTLRGPRGGMVLIGKDMPNALGIKARKSGRIRNYSEILDSAVMPGLQGGPLMHVIAGKAVSFKEALAPSFHEYQEQTLKNAKRLGEVLKAEGLRLVSNDTDNHLLLLDLSKQGLTGREMEKYLDAANITVNKNAIPFDTKSLFVTSGIRLGTPALTTRGMREKEMEQVGEFISMIVKCGGNEKTINIVKEKVENFTKQFPLFAW